jgi:hypothetical protein
MMSQAGATTWRLVKLAAPAAIIAWAAVSSWYAWQARPIRSSTSSPLPPEGAATVTPEEQAAAAKLFAGVQDRQQRFLAVVEAAKVQERDGADADAVREALAAAMKAAAAGDVEAVDARIATAERMLDEMGLGGSSVAAGGTAAAVAGMVARIEPAYLLGRELLTEGHAAVEKLVRRASRDLTTGEPGRAAALLQLAADLSGGETPAPAAATVPEWFTALADAPPTTATQAEAEAAVSLAEAMAASESPAPPVMTLVKRARRELDAGRPNEAYWWAGVALNALGIAEEAVAAR